MNHNENIHTLKMMVQGMYQIQDMKIRAGNRLSAYYREKLGIEPSTKTDINCSMDAVKAEFKKIVGNPEELSSRRKYLYEGLIANYAELVMVRHYIHLEQEEKSIEKSLKYVLRTIPVYAEYLEGIEGVGPAMAGVIISQIDIHKAKYASSIWKYAGLDVAPDGKGRSRRSEHLEDSEYIDKNNELKKKKGITFNPFLKTKLVGVLGSSFLRVGGDKYKEIYYNYKNRLESTPGHAMWNLDGLEYNPNLARWNLDGLESTVAVPPDVWNYLYVNRQEGTWKMSLHEPKTKPREQGYTFPSKDEHGKYLALNSDGSVRLEPVEYDNKKNLTKIRLRIAGKGIAVYRKGKTKGHRHNMANRYMIKMFIIDLYENWRTIEGLPVYAPYHEAKLGLKHAV